MSIEAIAFIKTLEPSKKAKPAWHLMFVIAENTFNDSGRCLLGQEQLGYEAGRKSVRTVSRQLKVLQEEGLIDRKPRFNCDGGRAFDEIELKNFVRWYKKQHPDRPEPGKPKTKPAKVSGMVKPEGNATQDAPPPQTFCRVGDALPDTLSGGANRTPVTGHTGQQVSGSYKESRTSTVQEDLPPNPRKRGREGRLELLIEAVRSGPGRERVVSKLIEPLLAQRAFDAPHKEYALGVIADWAKDFPDSVFTAALATLLKKRKTKAFQKDLQDALEDARKFEERAQDSRKALNEQRDREMNNPDGEYRRKLADQLIDGDLGHRAAVEDWLVELWHFVRETGALPGTQDIGRVIAKRDELKSKNEEWDGSALHQRFAETARLVRARDDKKFRALLGLPERAPAPQSTGRAA